ncbi:MAG: nucleotide exchange factor GrpE [Gammaproteobacteria bacterium]|nr:nucleotide exchange factor GrpE [Gammaproteobacteria bacterium]
MSDEAVLENTPENSQATENTSADQVTLTPAEELAERLQAAEKKAADNWDQLLRTRAEMENLRRRTQRDLENAHKYALEKFVTELLPVKDSLEMGLDVAKQGSVDVAKICEGTELTLNMLVNALGKFNVVEINPRGEKFNPEQHQAMAMQPSADMEPNTVMVVMQKGYLLNDRLMRPAMVMVSKAPDQ